MAEAGIGGAVREEEGVEEAGSPRWVRGEVGMGEAGREEAGILAEVCGEVGRISCQPTIARSWQLKRGWLEERAMRCGEGQQRESERRGSVPSSFRKGAAAVLPRCVASTARSRLMHWMLGCWRQLQMCAPSQHPKLPPTCITKTMCSSQICAAAKDQQGSRWGRRAVLGGRRRLRGVWWGGWWRAVRAGWRVGGLQGSMRGSEHTGLAPNR